MSFHAVAYQARQSTFLWGARLGQRCLLAGLLRLWVHASPGGPLLCSQPPIPTPSFVPVLVSSHLQVSGCRRLSWQKTNPAKKCAVTLAPELAYCKVKPTPVLARGSSDGWEMGKHSQRSGWDGSSGQEGCLELSQKHTLRHQPATFKTEFCLHPHSNDSLRSPR